MSLIVITCKEMRIYYHIKRPQGTCMFLVCIFLIASLSTNCQFFLMSLDLLQSATNGTLIQKSGQEKR